ncbi:hypothetical protein B5V02_30395 [Mesorhizobium kowhaii]|uniref:Uncharacterized protein n=2 Tax=Mesorhizobium kowhaii TaxID=1300272 RepID=A0A2W7BXP6_9HYPH|nr:hypothetical protein B5V02_30395 [Mesorhizobium kowhaii]
MKRLWPFTCFVLTVACAFTGARAQDFDRAPGEDDMAFAKRVVGFSNEADPHTTAVSWNGLQTLFVDYETTDEYPERPLVALQQQSENGYRTIQITVGEQEGGTPDIALGLANADHDPAKELIVILAWPQKHYDVEGTLYEARIFDSPKPGRKALAQLKVSQKFDATCDCSWRDGTTERSRFKTIAAVKAELKRLGY